MIDLNKETNNPYTTSGTEWGLKVKYWFIRGENTERRLPVSPTSTQAGAIHFSLWSSESLPMQLGMSG